jgi:hypothetical protein
MAEFKKQKLENESQFSQLSSQSDLELSQLSNETFENVQCEPINKTVFNVLGLSITNKDNDILKRLFSLDNSNLKDASSKIPSLYPNIQYLISQEISDVSSFGSSVSNIDNRTEASEIIIDVDPSFPTDPTNPDMTNEEKIRERAKLLLSLSPTFATGKRSRVGSRNISRKNKRIKGGFVTKKWVCDHSIFVTFIVMMSLLGGGFWCIASYIIPTAIRELGSVLWNHIVKICEATAVVITNVFKTNGGMNKFIDLLANFYTGKAVIIHSANDIHKVLIQPVFEYIKNIIEKSFCNSSSSKKTEPTQKEFDELLAKLTELQKKINLLESDNDVASEDSKSKAKSESKTISESSIKETKENFNTLIEEINIIHDELLNSESTNKGGNIYTYLSRKIKKTLQRRKYSKKNKKKKFK